MAQISKPNLRLVLMAVAIMFSATCCENDEEDTVIKDGDGNIYTTVTIGNQVWLKENLMTSSYFNGEKFPWIGDNEDWDNLTTPSWCPYNNISAECGHLYNWYAVSTDRICPQGFHVPTRDEWEGLVASQGGELVAGGNVKQAGTTLWKEPNDATNTSGFTALPGGVRGNTGGFGYYGSSGYYWSSTENSGSTAWHIVLSYSNTWMPIYSTSKEYGLSVRCIKD
jgi:uncharacterized protein (TIGR02145 family)